MLILSISPDAQGRHNFQLYSNPQPTIPDGFVAVPTALVDNWEQHKPFVTLIIEYGEIVQIEDNVEARTAWEAEQSESDRLIDPLVAVQLAALEQENVELKAKVKAAEYSSYMLEECLVEMAMIVYA